MNELKFKQQGLLGRDWLDKKNLIQAKTVKKEPNRKIFRLRSC